MGQTHKSTAVPNTGSKNDPKVGVVLDDRLGMPVNGLGRRARSVPRFRDSTRTAASASTQSWKAFQKPSVCLFARSAR